MVSFSRPRVTQPSVRRVPVALEMIDVLAVPHNRLAQGACLHGDRLSQRSIVMHSHTMRYLSDYKEERAVGRREGDEGGRVHVQCYQWVAYHDTMHCLPLHVLSASCCFYAVCLSLDGQYVQHQRPKR